MRKLVELVVQDLRLAVRSLARAPGFTLTAAVTLAVAVGVATAMFAVADALLLRPVPFKDPDRLARLSMMGPHGGYVGVVPAVLQAWRDSPALEGAEGATLGVSLLDIGGMPVARGSARVTPALFDMLGGVRPILGRLFVPGEGQAGTDDRIVISEDVWRGLYGADASIIGRRIFVDDEAVVVVGVLPADFRFPAWDTVLWRPVDYTRVPPAADDSRPTAYVRLAAGVPVEDVLRAATDAAHAVDASTAHLNATPQALVALQQDRYYKRALPLLGGGVILVFLALCANVGGLFLARLESRRIEFGLRAGLGASRKRLLAQATVESGVVAALGTAGGLALAASLVGLARTVVPAALMVRTLNPLGLDARALLVTSCAGAAAVLVAGVLPAWLGTRVDGRRALIGDGRRAATPRATQTMTRVLLGGEVACACVLLLGATLLVRSFVNLTSVDPGLDTEGVVVADMGLPAASFPDEASRAAAVQAMQDAVAGLGGVARTTWSYGVPPTQGAWRSDDWSSDVLETPVSLRIDSYYVSPEFFDLYRIPLLGGRTFNSSDTPQHVVVGERLAQVLWPGLNPVGRTFSGGDERFEVVGVVGEVRLPTVDKEEDRPEFYRPFIGARYAMAFLSVRCAGPCPDTAVLRRQLRVNPAVAVYSVRRLEDVYAETLARPRAAAALGFVFAAIAVLAAAGGLFSVLTYAVGMRQRELGIRTALGATPLRLGRLIMRDGVLVGAIGAGAGALLALPLGSLLASVQYGVTLGDPASWGIVAAALAGATLTAVWRPVRYAMRTDPVVLLREE